MKKTLRDLQLAYYAVYILAIMAALLGYYVLRAGVNIDPLSATGTALSSILIIYIIGSIPGSLWLFHRYSLKLQKEPDITIRLSKYKKAAFIRLAAIGIAFIAGVIFYYILRSQSMIFCAGIAAIGLFFCKPAEVKIISDLQIEEPEV
jgi:hypothetical protein